MGAIQGLTEFLPISSSGHLVVLKALWHVRAPGSTLEVALHLGTLLAVFILYHRQLGFSARSRGRWWSSGTLRLLGWGTLPAAVVGGALADWIGLRFTPEAVAIGWLGTTGVLWLTPPPERGHRRLAEMTVGDALWIGVAQAFALWPGLSRSGTTIFMARRLGLCPEDAAAFSFMLLIPAVAGASLLTLLAGWPVPGLHPAALVTAMAVAMLTGLLAARVVRLAVGRVAVWRLFGVYTLVMAIVARRIGI